MKIYPQNSIIRNTVVLDYNTPHIEDVGVEGVLYVFGLNMYRWNESAQEWVHLNPVIPEEDPHIAEWARVYGRY